MEGSGSTGWQLKLLDHVQFGDARGDAGLTAVKAIAMLGYLALQRSRTARRDAVAGLLWEKVDTAQGRVNLRQALAAIRRAEAGGPPILRADPDTLTLSDSVETDIDRFDRLASGNPADRRMAADIYQTDLMTGFSVRDAHAFDEWLAIAQAQWRQKAVGLLMRLADESLASGGDLNAGAAAALKLLAIDPLNEAGHRTLMRIYARQGRAALALAQYRSLSELLRTELQVAPDAETQQLAEELRSGRRQAPPRAPSAIPPEAPVVPDPAVSPSPETEPTATAPISDRPQRPRRRQIAWAAGLAAVGLGGTALWFGTTRDEAPLIKRIFSIAATDDQEISPAISPDGRTVVYTVRKQGNVDLYLASADGRTEPVRLTTDPLEDRGAAWSPDGQSIAFSRGNRSSDHPCAIVVRQMASAAERVVGHCRTQPSTRLAWSGSGDALFFFDDADRNRAAQIFRLPLAGGPAVAVSRPSDEVYGDYRALPSWGGTRLAIVRENSSASATVVVQGMGGGAERTLVPNTAGLLDAAWSKDDRGILYLIGEGTDAGLWWQPAGHTRPRQRLTTGLSGYSSLSFAPLRNRLALQVSQDRRTMLRLPGDATSMAQQQPIPGLRSEVSDHYLAQGPGGRIALVSSRAGSDDLWVGGPGMPLRQLTRGFTFGQPAWSPDGRFVAASGDVGGQADIYLVDARSGRVIRVTNDAAGDSFPNWTANGRFLFWSSLRGGVASVWIVEPGRPRQPPRQLAGSGIGLITAGVRGDDAYYYVRWGTNVLYRRSYDANGDFAGQEAVALPNLLTARAPTWAVGPGTITYLALEAGTGTRYVYSRDLGTGRDTRIAGSDALTGRLVLAAAPHGSAIITHTTSQNDITGIDFE